MSEMKSIAGGGGHRVWLYILRDHLIMITGPAEQVGSVGLGPDQFFRQPRFLENVILYVFKRPCNAT